MRVMRVAGIMVLALTVAGCVPFALAPPRGASLTVEYRLIATDDQPITPEILGETRTIIEERLMATEPWGIDVSSRPPDGIVIRVPETADLEGIRRLVGTTGRLDFIPVPAQFSASVNQGEPLPVGMPDTPLFSGDQIASATAGTNQLGQLAVDLELKETGARLFDDWAARNVGERFAIVLDGIVISAPQSNATRYGGRAQITGNFTTDSRDELVTVLKFGALPVGIEEVGFTQVGASPRSSDAWDTQEIVIIQLTPSDGATLTEEQHAAAETVVRDRLAALAAFGAPDVSVGAIPDGRLRIEVPDPGWSDVVRRVATAPGELTLEAIPAEYTGEVMTGEPLPAGMSTEVIVVPGHVLVATPGTSDDGEPIVDLRLDDVGAAAFDAWAADHIGQRLAVILDGVVLTAPMSNAPRYQGQVQIAGNLDRGSMQELAAILAGGILPVRAEVLWLCPADDPTPVCPSPMPAAS